MKKIIKLLSLTCSLFLLSLNAQAYSRVAGLYFGGELGACNLHYQNSALAQGTYEVDDKGWAGRLIAGFDINPNLGLELGYTIYHNPEFKYTNGFTTLTTDFSQESLDFLAKVSLPITCNVSLFAKGGLACVQRDDLKATIDNVIIKDDAADTHVRPMLGAGINYHFTTRVSGDLVYYRTFGTEDLEDADFYGVGLTVRVG